MRCPGTAVKYALSKHTVPHPCDIDPDPVLNQNYRRQSSTAKSAPVTTRRPSLEKPISIATSQRSTHSTTHLQEGSYHNVPGLIAIERGRMGSPEGTRCCSIRI